MLRLMSLIKQGMKSEETYDYAKMKTGILTNNILERLFTIVKELL